MLEDGLGDTIRVSLTEEPGPRYVAAPWPTATPHAKGDPIPEIDRAAVRPFAHERRHTREVLNIGARHVPVVMADLSGKEKITPASLFSWGYACSVPLDKWNLADQACDYAFIGKHRIDFEIPGTLGIVQEHATWLLDRDKERHYPQVSAKDYRSGVDRHPQLNFVHCTLKEVDDAFLAQMKDDPTAVLLLDTWNDHGMAEQRRLIVALMQQGCDVPVMPRPGLR